MAALLVVMLALALATGDRRIRLAVGLLALAALVAGAAYGALQLVDGESINRITSDRTERVEDTLRVIEEHPLKAWGSVASPGPAACWRAATGPRPISSPTPPR